MKRILYFIISVLLLNSSLTSCSTIKENNGASLNNPSVKVQKQGSDETITDLLHFISFENNIEDGKVVSDINLILIDNNGKIVGKTKTGKDGIADITVTVPLDKRYESKTGTITVIGYNNEKYRRTVMYEVPVIGTGQFNQNITMIPKDGGRDDEVNISYGNIFHMIPMTLAEKYAPWNTK